MPSLLLREVTGAPDEVVQVRTHLARSLEGGAPLAVLPDQPAPWRDRLAAAVQPARPVPPGVALVVPTSGSAGEPTGLLLGADALTWAAQRVTARLGGAGSWLLALPLTHVAGLMVLVRSHVAGTDVVALDLTQGFTSQAFAAAVQVLPGPRTYASLVPTQLARVLDSDAAPAAARLDAVLLGGAGAPPALLERAAAAGVRVVTSYGMTETCGGCVLDGVPLPGVTVTLDTAGRIHLDGPMLATARRSAQGEAPLPRPLPTPDAGRWHHGALQVLGRLDDVVVTGGVSVPLGSVEQLLSEHPGLADVAAVGVPDARWGTQVVVVAVPRDPARPPTAAQVRAFVHARAEPAFVPAQVVLVDALPRPAPGKLDRRALRALVETP
jgi:O-succinylbenzoic acid--CoA ligase